MKIIVSFARFFVGLLFVVSGLIKVNDPLGFSFKLEEYFSSAVLNLEFLTPFALAIALFIVIFETVLGVMLLVGFKPKFTVWSLLIMIVFFTFLTFYSAYFNKVTDCGCFGDAIKLTPWQSFAKDVVLLILIVLLFAKQHLIKPLHSKRAALIASTLSVVLCIAFSYYVLNHLPAIDFRAYKVGVNIADGMEVPENAPKDVYEYQWKFKVNNTEKIITTTGAYPNVDGEFIGVETKLIEKGYEPPIHDFTIEKDGEDFAAEFLSEPKLIMVISYDLSRANLSAFSEVKKMAKTATDKGYKVIGLSASGVQQVQQVKQQFGLSFPFYFTDMTTLKTIVRSNPGILVLHNGTIVQKLHYNNIHKVKL